MAIDFENNCLPKHGRINCNRCFGMLPVNWGETTHEPGDGWSITNNPMSWGSQLPSTIVLGFSKGGNQNSGILEAPHNDVAFRGGRHNLSIILETLGLKASYWPIDDLISCQNGKFAFGSLVRCSIKKRDGNKWLMTGKDIMSSCLRDRKMGVVIDNCVTQFLAELPASVRNVVMLGNDMKYIAGCYSAIRKVRPNLRKINSVAYSDDQVTFVHSVHFKAQGALVPNWASGSPGQSAKPETDQPLKRILAQEAIVASLCRPYEWKSQNRKLYHATNAENRDSILKHGLVLNPKSEESTVSITGGFFFSEKIPAPANQIDVWEVDAKGFVLQLDDTDMPLEHDDTWWVLYGHDCVVPERLKLIQTD